MNWIDFLNDYRKKHNLSLREAMKSNECKILYHQQKGGSGMIGGSTKKYRMLELFKGTGSVGKVAKKMGFEVVSLDLDPIYTPEIETDILDWDYKEFYRKTKFLPDFIWASPPCNTYSVLAYSLKERDTKTAEPFSERAKEGTRILYKTLEIISYFKKLNPTLLFTIENPRGMMRHDKKMKQLYMENTLYCLYGDKDKRKSTDFWSNFVMGLNQTEKDCPTKFKQNVSRINDIIIKYRIPAALVRRILTKVIETMKTL